MAQSEVVSDRSNPLGSAFAPIIGLPAWGVQRGHGSFLTMEFGPPHLVIREPKQVMLGASSSVKRLSTRRRVFPRGANHLWIYCCCWRAIVHGVEIATSEAGDADIDAAVRQIDGQRLLSVKANPAAGTSRFHFDLGAVLETWPADQESDEQWMLYAEDGSVFTYRADGYYSWEPGSRTPDDEVWRPLQAGCSQSGG